MTNRRAEQSVTGKVRKEAAFIMVTILIILSLWLFISEKVMSQTSDNVTVDEKSYLELEADYLAEVRSFLEKEGYHNSGVSLSRVVDENGNRSYEIMLHHKNIYKLTEAELDNLLKDIAEMAFHVSGCEFQVKLLV